jgi:uncharacterized protein
MKLQPDRFDVPSVTAYGEGWLAVNGQRYESSVMLGGVAGVTPIDANAHNGADAALLERAAALLDPAPEVVLVGTGALHRQLHPKEMRALMAQRIGVECMDTQAACRTYNILAGEGRRVCAILLM